MKRLTECLICKYPARLYDSLACELEYVATGLLMGEREKKIIKGRMHRECAGKVGYKKYQGRG